MSSDKRSTIAPVVDELLQKARHVAKGQGITADSVADGTIVGLTDARVVHFVSGAPDDRLSTCKTLNAMGVSFTAALAAHGGRSVAWPWSPTDRAPKALTTHGRSSGVKEFTAPGKWPNQ
eukprot:1060758-Pyramimonas_sp.AAC.1